MGFVHVRRDASGNPVPGYPKETVALEHLEPARAGPFAQVTWRMLDDLGYEPPVGTEGLRPLYVAPAHPVGASTDLASVPPWLWGVIASFGRHTFAALLHDHLCEEAARAGSPALRREADRVFRVAMRDLRVPAVRRWVMWAAVRLFGEVGCPGPVAKLPALAVVAATVAAWWAALGTLAGGDTGTAALVAIVAWFGSAVVAAAVRRPDLAGAVLVGALAGAVVAPAFAVSFVTVLLLDGLPIAGWALRKLASRLPRSPFRDPGPPPQAGPMRTP